MSLNFPLRIPFYNYHFLYKPVPSDYFPRTNSLFQPFKCLSPPILQPLGSKLLLNDDTRFRFLLDSIQSPVSLYLFDGKLNLKYLGIPEYIHPLVVVFE